MSDEDIIRDVLAGNVNRYAEIVREYQTIVANLCYRMGCRGDDVEEVTQRVFVELYQALPRFRFQSKLSTFIYRITVNQVCKEQSRSQRIVYSTDIVSSMAIPSDGRNAEQAIIHDEQISQLREAIGRLHREQRTALVLYTFDNFSYNDIADVMQCTTAKVESLIFRARKNLAKMLNTSKS